MHYESFFREGFLGVPKSEKPEFTTVNEDFEDKGNVKSASKKSRIILRLHLLCADVGHNQIIQNLHI